MGMRFNPPPNWPALPPRWTPPPGWQPDPGWPPAPPGWSLWLAEDTPAGAAPIRPALQRGWHWFGSRPGWVKALLVLLAIGLLPWLLIVGGLAAAAVAAAGLLRGSVRRLGLASRTAATLTLSAGLLSIVAGTALAVSLTTTRTPQPAAGRTAAPPAATLTATNTAGRPAPPQTTPPPTTAPRTTPPPVTRPAAPTAAAPSHTATTPTRPSAPPTTAAPPAAARCGAPPNPYGYNFCGRGGLVTDPPRNICNYFSCIDNFWNGVGHMEECQDQTYSMSGGRPGSCSHHGGNLRAVNGGP
jgi:hypothetical protein